MGDDEESQGGPDISLLVDDGEPPAGLRHRGQRSDFDHGSRIDEGTSSHFASASEESERIDRSERCLYIAITCFLFCGVLGMVAVHKLILDWQGGPSQEPSPATQDRDRFIYLNHSTWSGYEHARSACLSPSDDEAAVWASVGEICAKGACLDIGELMRALKTRAERDGEAYSTMGYTERGASLPCAYAWRDENGTVRSYLGPKLSERRGRLYEVKVEIEFLGGHVATLVVPQTALVEHRAHPTGEKMETIVNGTEVVRWALAEFILGTLDDV